ncbi:MAG: metallophosphoesterase [Acidobacteriota bacterium]
MSDGTNETARPRSRHIFIGDIHGCYDELVELLDQLSPSSHDTVISLGDLTRKGPDPVGCLDLFVGHGYQAVQGNQDRALIALSRFPARLFLPHNDRALAHRQDLMLWISSLPLSLDFPGIGVAAVHGGVLPGVSFADQAALRDAGILTNLRFVRQCGEEWIPIPRSRKQEGDVFWAEVWNGDRFIVYGHTPRSVPRRDSAALGLDTGCVYGGALTAGVFDGETWTTHSVRARRAYKTKS